ncbi:hypothetical protein D7Y27_15775 [Corallococcus sp. AB004]|nr:hypothetical protein D7Y27_15775 [Corallococcus sp. AB004]
MHCPHESLNPTPKQDAAFAVEALAAGELAHAAFHAGCALGADARYAPWLELLERIIQAAGPSPFHLFPLGDGASFATAAVHAYALARSGQPGLALELLSQVVQAKPDADFARWGVTWLEAPGIAESTPPQYALPLVTSVLSRTSPNETQGLAVLLRIVERIASQHPENAGVLWVHGTLLRRCGRGDEGLAVARASYDAQPGWLTAVQLATAHRELGQVPQALDAYRAALRHDPPQVSVLLDAADMLCEHARVDEGLRWYEDALRLAPGDLWASASSAYWRAIHHGDTDAQERLLALADTHPEHERTGMLAADLARRLTPFEDFLPLRTDAGIHALRQLSLQPPPARRGPPSRVTLTTSWLEAPSVLLAWELQRAWKDFPYEVDIQVQRLQQPNPRLPTGPTSLTLWTFSETRPTRAVPPPPPAFAAAVAELAARPFQAERWWREAGPLAAALPSGEVTRLAHVMVHPPPLRGRWSAWSWLQRVQVAAVFIAARVDDGWEGSPRRELLLSLAHGPMDWTVDAALLALARIARATPAAHEEVLGLFRELGRHTREYRSYTYTLTCAHLQLPGLPVAERAALEQQREALQRGEEG